jgi:glycosyltransferase involved in cell wall biosynthesis
MDNAGGGTAPPGIHFFAPVYGGSGYAEEALEVVLGLACNGLPVHLQPMYFQSDTRGLLAPPVRDALECLKRRPIDPARSIVFELLSACDFNFDVNGRYRVGRTMFETDRLPEDWVAYCQAMDEIWVPSSFNWKTFVAAGVDEHRVRCVREGLHTHKFRPGLEPLRIPHAREFKFLSVFEWAQRKGPDVLLRAYVTEFKPDEDVTLILKTYAKDRPSADLMPELLWRVEREIGVPFEKTPPIVLLTGLLPNAEMPRLYATADAFVLATRGEGWGRPYAEALSSACPVIATRWSGHLDFLTDENSYLVDCRLVPTPRTVDVELYAGHRWAEPDVDHLRAQMRHVFTHREEARQRAERGRALMVKHWDWDVVIKLWISEFERLLA